jgi:hypothetical protein
MLYIIEKMRNETEEKKAKKESLINLSMLSLVQHVVQVSIL